MWIYKDMNMNKQGQQRHSLALRMDTSGDLFNLEAHEGSKQVNECQWYIGFQ